MLIVNSLEVYNIFHHLFFKPVSTGPDSLIDNQFKTLGFFYEDFWLLLNDNLEVSNEFASIEVIICLLI